MARIRTIRRWEGAAVSVGAGLVLLLAALAWRQLDPPADPTDADPGLPAMETACSEKLHGDARTGSTTPDAAAARPDRPGGDPHAAAARPSGGTAASSAGTASSAAGAADATPGPGRRLRLTDYGWAARNAHLRNDPCTRLYRRRLELGR